MAIILTTLLFSLRTLLSSDILVWVVGVPLVVLGVVLLYVQHRSNRSLKSELAQLEHMQSHSVEYDLVLKAMKIAVWRMDLLSRTITFETDYREGNDSFTPAPGTPVGEVRKRLPAEHAEQYLQAIDDLRSGHTDVAHLQYQVLQPYSGNTYWSETYATVDRRDLDGHPLSIVGTVKRIDQQKNTERALIDALYHAEESDRLKTAFLANISHEIRTPLNAIVGFSDVLTTVDDPQERQNLIALIQQNNNRLLHLFDDIVSMSKLEARGNAPLNSTRFALSALYRELVGQYQEAADAKGLSIVIADEQQLPQLTTDRERLGEILGHYIDNALKFTVEGGVTLGCSEQSAAWRLYVSDTGIGIPDELCSERLFERFVKLDDFATGTGLGLSICRSMAQTLGGKVGVSSRQGVGSTFWVELPV